MLLYGASGHGKVVRDILHRQGVQVDAFIDDNKAVKRFDGLVVHHALPSTAITGLIVSVGDNRIRKRLVERLTIPFGIAVHPRSSVADSVLLGEGTVVMANATVNPCTRIGKHCIINTNASVDHDAAIGDFVHISPNAALAGHVTVGEGAHVGIGACIIQGINVGKWAIIGAGTVVIADVPDYAVVVGNPARVIRSQDDEHE